MGGWLNLTATATDSADWAETVEITDDTTGEAYDASAEEFRLEITDCGSALLTASTEAGADVLMTRPASNQISWRFTADQMATLCAGKTYAVGCVRKDGDGNITQFIVGELAVVSGGMSG
jgi:hypothetical protein